MPFTPLLVAALVVFRVTHLLAKEDGPWRLVVRLRRVVGEGFWGELLDCFYCLSLWVAAPLALALGTSWSERLLLWPALSGAAILLERLIPPAPAEPALYFEEEPRAVLLRQQPPSPDPATPSASP